METCEHTVLRRKEDGYLCIGCMEVMTALSSQVWVLEIENTEDGGVDVNIFDSDGPKVYEYIREYFDGYTFTVEVEDEDGDKVDEDQEASEALPKVADEALIEFIANELDWYSISFYTTNIQKGKT